MKILRSIVVLLMLGSCVDPYLPELNPLTQELLVVDGFIDSEGYASVKLSRAIGLYDIGNPLAETNAEVSITTSGGETFSLPETTPGTYYDSSLVVDKTVEYSLHVKTASGREYFSDNVKILPTPEIDSIYHKVASNGEFIEIVTDSHDENPNSTGYYLFDAVETYEYHAQVFSKYMVQGSLPIERPEEEQAGSCWLTTTTMPVVSNTNTLSRKVITGQVVSRLERYSKQLSQKYSALVRQRSITAAEHYYRDQIAKTTEQTGSMFGVIPGAVVGNIHASGSNEPVLGWFGGRETKTKRFFLYVNDLPDYFKVQRLIPCKRDFTCVIGAAQVDKPKDCSEIYQLPPQTPIIDLYMTPTRVLIQVSYVTRECGDCRSWGGVNKPPPFWNDDY